VGGGQFQLFPYAQPVNVMHPSHHARAAAAAAAAAAQHSRSSSMDSIVLEECLLMDELLHAAEEYTPAGNLNLALMAAGGPGEISASSSIDFQVDTGLQSLSLVAEAMQVDGNGRDAEFLNL
jgi:hypothetical protein